MLANLDNEVHFKKVFTDVEVFTAFVKDVLGIEIHMIAEQAAKRTDRKRIIRALNIGKMSKSDIAELFEVSIEYVQHIANEISPGLK